MSVPVREAVRSKAPSAAGFTLLEVAIAMAILGVGIVTVLQIFGASLRLQDRATRETAAVREARATMDSYLAESGDRFAENGAREERHVSEVGFTTHTSIRLEKLDEDPSCHPTHDLYRLQVTVTWQDGLGAKKYVLESLRAAPNNGSVPP